MPLLVLRSLSAAAVHAVGFVGVGGKRGMRVWAGVGVGVGRWSTCLGVRLFWGHGK